MFLSFFQLVILSLAGKSAVSPAQLMPLLLSGAGALICLAVLLFFPHLLRYNRQHKNKLESRSGKDLPSAEGSWEEILDQTGFVYDPFQDIFYSGMNSWQRKYGYCQLYDEAAAPLSMIVDCEPIRFEYKNKKWLIEFWKGQYGMTTGGEVGIYNTEKPDLDIKRFFTGTFYDSVSDNEMLPITFTLYKDNKPLFIRSKRHWWLTGFILGEFSEPTQLSMEITIVFKDTPMASAFVTALRKLDYTSNEYFQNSNLVKITYKTPHSSQPLSRTAATDWITQRKNKLLCSEFQEMTKDYSKSSDKLEFIQKENPKMLRTLLKMGKPRLQYKLYNKLQKHSHDSDFTF